MRYAVAVLLYCVALAYAQPAAGPDARVLAAPPAGALLEGLGDDAPRAADGHAPAQGTEDPSRAEAHEEDWDDISTATIERRPHRTVAQGSGPSVAHVQILLDRADFSPGIIDGHWGQNTEKAVYWFQAEHDLARTGRVDAASYERLRAAAGSPPSLVRAYTVTADDLAGPYFALPGDVYDRARLDRLVYESPLEMLTERFHVHPRLLRQLNPGVDLDDLRAGTPLDVPDVTVVREDPEAADLVDRIRISIDGLHLHAYDAAGRIRFHFPITLGAGYDPERFAQQRVTAVVFDPDFRYQPRLHANKPGPDAILPPGPNSPVGLVWMELEAPGYGIHGTPSPRTIGYEKSLGCVRLTNWDALLLANHTRIGTPVEFH